MAHKLLELALFWVVNIISRSQLSVGYSARVVNGVLPWLD